LSALVEKKVPSFSIVVNTCDRKNNLRTLLYSLSQQTYKNFEVIVVLGPTKDDSEDMIKKEFLVRCPAFNLSVSRNMGIYASQGDVIAFIDDDAVPTKTWLEQLSEAYINNDHIAGFGGRVYNINPQEGNLQFLQGMISVTALQMDVRENNELRKLFFLSEKDWYPRFMGTNMSYRKDALLEVGGFDEFFKFSHEETDLGLRLGYIGKEIKNLDQATVYHVPTSGRNRNNAVRYDVNWYALTKSHLYATLKNSLAFKGLLVALFYVNRTILSYIYHYVLLLIHNNLPGKLKFTVLFQHVAGIMHGIYGGIFLKRKIAQTKNRIKRDFLPFLNDSSKYFSKIDPLSISKNLELKTVAAKPLSICFVHHPESDKFQSVIKILSQYFFESGHEVHSVQYGPQDTIIFKDFAYVHSVKSDNNATDIAPADSIKKSVIKGLTNIDINHNVDILVLPISLVGILEEKPLDIPFILYLDPLFIARCNKDLSIQEQESYRQKVEQSKGILDDSEEAIKRCKTIIEMHAKCGKKQAEEKGNENYNIQKKELFERVLGNRKK